ncbi:Conserved hypothetical protein, DUF5057 domain [Clostridium neonatale]|uniref:DUF5057 domain-containing protein n=1 Tax=Clostridium neonatale TaxID=137838 RepID=UPI00291B44AA|nr:Conserved hypothetical protein, DUF5057 domain [Clostridium neonatale]CAI3733358.1 Conserved hypothetical protein, DUF5057 domain [Clostridium neonatale]
MKIKKGSLKIILLLAVFTFVVTSIRLLPIKADNFNDYIESNDNIININFDTSINSGIKSVGEDLNIKYNINLNDFTKGTDEAVFLIDASLRMRKNTDWSDNDRLKLAQNIINNIDKNNSNFKVGVIGFAQNIYNLLTNDWTSTDASKIKMYDMSNSDDAKVVHSMGDQILTINDWTQSNDVSLDLALEKSFDLLGDDNSSNNKSIVIITAGNANISQDVANKIKNIGYKIILLDISSEKNYTTIPDSEYNLKNIIEAIGDKQIKKYSIDKNNNLNESDLNEMKSNKSIYLKLNPVSINNGNNISFSDEGLSLLSANAIMNGAKSLDIESDYFNIQNPRIRFDMGDDFNVDDNLEVKIKYGKREDNLIVSNNNNIIEIDLSNFITYKIENSSFVPDIKNIEISFNINTKTVGNNISFSKDTNGISKSYLLYTLKKGNVYTNQKKILELPNIRVENYNSNVLPIKILEIEPADSFKLTFGNETHIRTGKEYGIINSGNEGYQVEIEHMSMPEFVGKVDKLNGKYDVIVIGRYIDYNNITDSINQDQLPYRDYNLDQKIGNSSVENDITDRKANEIIDFAQSGQLVYIDKTIINSNDNNFKNLKLYKNFSSISQNNTYNANHSISDLTLNKIIEDYLGSNVRKRFKFKLSTPVGDSMEDEKGDINKRNMVFRIKPEQNSINENQKIDIRLYIDENGDGLFKENEVVKELENITTSNNEIQLEYKISSDFIGYLTWKIEIVNKDDDINENNLVKSYETGSIIFRSLTGDKMSINVLQISPYDKNSLNDKINGNLNLSTEGSVGNDRFKNLLSQLKDYDIKIEAKSVDEINEMADNNVFELNGKYQMIIVGFGDTFNNSDLNEKAVSKINEYIDTNQGIMLTHDTISPWFSKNLSNGLIERLGFKELDKKESWVSEKRLEYKRSIFDGQSNSVNRAQSKVVYNNNSTVVSNYPFKLIDDDKYINIRRTHSQYYQLDLENENVIPLFTEIPNTVGGSGTKPDYDGQVPDDIVKELQNNNMSIDSMKNDDYSYWDISNEINQYDVKNNYYTYSIGNITFSGTGENSRENSTPYPTEELKLFANTITKAIKSANHAPVINSIYPDEIFRDERLILNNTFSDMDNDKIKASIYIVNDDNEELLISQYNDMETGTSKVLEIEKSKYSNKDKIKIKIVAEDEHGAQSEKIIEIKINQRESLLKVETSGAKGLVGDVIYTSIKVIKNNDNVSNVKVKVNDDSIEDQLFEYKGNSEISVNFNSVNEKELQFELEAKGETPSGCTMSVIISYEYNGTNYSIERELPVAIKNGYIKVKIEKDETVTEDVYPNVYINNEDAHMKSILSKEINKASGSYNVTLGNIDGYIIKEQNPSDGKISINYDNPVGEYICTLSKAKEIVIIHGIFNDESREITENTYSDPYLLNKNDIVTCAAEITGLTGNNNTIKLNIDTNIIDISNIRVLDENLNPINSLTYNTNNNEFIWNNFNSNNNQKIIIIYTVKLSDNYTGIYRNTISVNEDNEKSVYIKFDNNKYLPDLF